MTGFIVTLSCLWYSIQIVQIVNKAWWTNDCACYSSVAWHYWMLTHFMRMVPHNRIRMQISTLCSSQLNVVVCIYTKVEVHGIHNALSCCLCHKRSMCCIVETMCLMLENTMQLMGLMHACSSNNNDLNWWEIVGIWDYLGLHYMCWGYGICTSMMICMSETFI